MSKVQQSIAITPAGEAVVSLFKVVGMFVEHDNALIKKEA